MSERISSGNRVSGGKWIFALITLAALVLVLAGPGWAQAQSTGSKSGQARTTTSAKAAVAPKGNSEGIKVHGHWTIDVKNPDGKVVTHREFENALVTGSGQAEIAAVLSGVLTPGPWLITLGAGCSTGIGGSCNIISPLAVALWSGYGSGSCSTSLTQVSSGTQPFCYETLTESLQAPAAGANFTQLVLAGSAYVDTSTSIPYVSTSILNCPTTSIIPAGPVTSPSSITPAACISTAGANAVPFTSRNLDGLHGDPAPVPVTPGQTVQVTVAISFM